MQVSLVSYSMPALRLMPMVQTTENLIPYCARVSQLFPAIAEAVWEVEPDFNIEAAKAEEHF